MPILSRLLRKHNRLAQPVLASRWERRAAATVVALDLPYLNGREWIDINVVSGRTFSFTTLHEARGYGPDHPWRWRSPAPYNATRHSGCKPQASSRRWRAIRSACS